MCELFGLSWVATSDDVHSLSSKNICLMLLHFKIATSVWAIRSVSSRDIWWSHLSHRRTSVWCYFISQNSYRSWKLCKLFSVSWVETSDDVHSLIEEHLFDVVTSILKIATPVENCLSYSVCFGLRHLSMSTSFYWRTSWEHLFDVMTSIIKITATVENCLSYSVCFELRHLPDVTRFYRRTSWEHPFDVMTSILIK